MSPRTKVSAELSQRHTQADLGFTDLHEQRSHSEMIATPLIADAATGYDGPMTVTRAVQAYARSG